MTQARDARRGRGGVSRRAHGTGMQIVAHVQQHLLRSAVIRVPRVVSVKRREGGLWSPCCFFFSDFHTVHPPQPLPSLVFRLHHPPVLPRVRCILRCHHSLPSSPFPPAHLVRAFIPFSASPLSPAYSNLLWPDYPPLAFPNQSCALPSSLIFPLVTPTSSLHLSSPHQTCQPPKLHPPLQSPLPLPPPPIPLPPSRQILPLPSPPPRPPPRPLRPSN